MHVRNKGNGQHIGFFLLVFTKLSSLPPFPCRSGPHFLLVRPRIREAFFCKALHEFSLQFLLLFEVCCPAGRAPAKFLPRLALCCCCCKCTVGSA